MGYWREIKIEDGFPFPPSVQKLSQKYDRYKRHDVAPAMQFTDEAA